MLHSGTKKEGEKVTILTALADRQEGGWPLLQLTAKKDWSLLLIFVPKPFPQSNPQSNPQLVY